MLSYLNIELIFTFCPVGGGHLERGRRETVLYAHRQPLPGQKEVRFGREIFCPSGQTQRSRGHVHAREQVGSGPPGGRSLHEVREVFVVHVGGTRCITSSTDNIMKIHARITLTVEFIRTCIFIF